MANAEPACQQGVWSYVQRLRGYAGSHDRLTAREPGSAQRHAVKKMLPHRQLRRSRRIGDNELIRTSKRNSCCKSYALCNAGSYANCLG